MRKIICFLLFGIIFVCSSCKHKGKQSDTTEVNKTVADINKKLSDYKTKHTDDLTSADPASITGYYGDDDEVKKLNAEYYGKDRRTFTEFYFDDGMLIYVFSQDFMYNRPTNYTEAIAKQNNDSEWYDDKKTKLRTASYYFSGQNEMYKWIVGGKEVSPGDSAFIDKQSEIWAQALIMIKELKEQQ